MQGMGKYFRTLIFERKAELVKKRGTFLGQRFYRKQKVLLYSVDIIFVELFFNAEENKILKVEEIKYENLEKFYLKNFKINIFR